MSSSTPLAPDLRAGHRGVVLDVAQGDGVQPPPDWDAEAHDEQDVRTGVQLTW